MLVMQAGDGSGDRADKIASEMLGPGADGQVPVLVSAEHIAQLELPGRRIDFVRSEILVRGRNSQCLVMWSEQLESPGLVARFHAEEVPLTVCPMSNVALNVVRCLEDHAIPRMLQGGLTVTINSDDPAYFGGYVGENYRAVADALGFDDVSLVHLARNSIDASFLPEERKAALRAELEEVAP